MGWKSSEARLAEGVLEAQTARVTGPALESVINVEDRGGFLRLVFASQTLEILGLRHEVVTAPCEWMMEG